MTRVILVSVFLLYTSVANALDIPYKDKMACFPDVVRHCKHLHVKDGLMAAVACLQQNKDKLTIRCKTTMAKYGA